MYIRFERASESIFRRVLIQDGSGNSSFHAEGLKVPGNTVLTVICTENLSQNSAIVSEAASTGGAAMSKINRKYPTMNYPSLDGAEKYYPCHISMV